MSSSNENISVSQFCDEFGLDQLNKFAACKMFAKSGDKTREQWRTFLTSNGIVIKKEIPKTSPVKTVKKVVTNEKKEEASSKSTNKSK
jgi:hypothetical protein